MLLTASCFSQRNHPKSFVCLLTLFAIGFAAIEAHTCSHCEPSKCAEPPEEDCPAGLAVDECGCCQVCAKQKNDSCDRKYGLNGQCGEGLVCVVNNRDSSRNLDSGNEEGICLESHECSTLKKYFGCNLEDGRCNCTNITSCNIPLFQFNTQEECDLSISDKCSGIKCIEDDSVCPEDSYKLPAIKVKEDDCCSVPQGCSCLPSCSIPACEEPLSPIIVQERTGKPGSCCHVYKCFKNDCYYNGKTYSEDFVWNPDPCHTCTCRYGISMCSRKVCDSSYNNCGRSAIPEGECCSVCIGCITSTGSIYNNLDTWQEDDCTKCTCENGQVNCQAEMCHVSCRNPIHIPGQCCDICNETTYVKLPPHCPALKNCSLLCSDGYEKDENDCFICKCKEDECHLDCPYGFVKDDFGVPLCECIQENNKCIPNFKCKNKCEHGYKLDKNGCKTCRCNQCKKLDCNRNCVNGFKTDDKGCPTCKCNPTDKTKLPKRRVNCQSVQLQPHEKTYWQDGCHNCICLDSREMCSLITCPIPHCDHPKIVKEECCPKCLDDFKASVQANLSVCEAFYGHTFIEGEKWNISSCISCICHEGRVLCETKSCPPIPCKNAIHKAGECCPTCPETKEIESSSSMSPCYSENGRLAYQHGSRWRKNSCESCICLSGKIECFSEACPRITCSQPLLPKNRCCPLCPAESVISHCVYNGTKYMNDESWSPNECLQCECLNGFIKCIEEQCPKICHNPVKRLGQCCPDCSGSKLPESTLHTVTSSTLLPVDNDDRSDNQPTEPSSKITILIIVCAACAFFFAIACIILLCIYCKQRQAHHKNSYDHPGIHYGKPKLTKIEYQGINGPAYFTSSGTKNFCDVDYKSILGNGNQCVIKAEKV